MEQIITITPQWQIYIPIQIRKILDLIRPSRAKVEVKAGKIVITPQESLLLKLGGKYRTLFKQRPINLEKIREQIDYSKL